MGGSIGCVVDVSEIELDQVFSLGKNVCLSHSRVCGCLFL